WRRNRVGTSTRRVGYAVDDDDPLRIETEKQTVRPRGRVYRRRPGNSNHCGSTVGAGFTPAPTANTALVGGTNGNSEGWCPWMWTYGLRNSAGFGVGGVFNSCERSRRRVSQE